MSDIRSILKGLVAIQAALTITDPVVASIKHAHSFRANRNDAIEPPCFMNAWDLIRIDRRLAGGAIMTYYTITSQLFVQDADLDVASDIASAFLEGYIVALQNNITLAGAVNISDLRGGTPTLAILEWAGKSYVGLHLLLDVQTQRGVSFA